MPLITFKAKRRILTEEDLELIERGIKTYEDNSDEWQWGKRTTSFRSEDIQSIEAFSPTQTLIWFYEGGSCIVYEPEKKVRHKLAEAISLEAKENPENIPLEEEEETEDDD